jgi:hypothetical protein
MDIKISFYASHIVVFLEYSYNLIIRYHTEYLSEMIHEYIYSTFYLGYMYTGRDIEPGMYPSYICISQKILQIKCK